MSETTLNCVSDFVATPRREIKSKRRPRFLLSAPPKRKRRRRISDVTNLLCEFVIHLDDVETLAKKYRGRYKLDLRAAKRPKCANRCSTNLLLEESLLDWEEELNEKCEHEPVIRVENIVDDCLPPRNFQFVLKNVANEEINQMFDEKYLVGCSCMRCSSQGCSCPGLSGGKFAYDRTKKVVLDPGYPIFECNKTCLCSDACPNRVVQQGRTVKVAIFRTPDGRGWGVKTLEFIPKNQFVLEYVGEIITSDEAEKRGRLYDAAQQTYLFDLDYTDDDATFTIDAYQYGNVSHFINHSCDPNLRVYGVFVDCLDARLPRIGFFAVRDIPAGQELTFDYLTSSNDDATGGSPITPSKHRKKEPALKKFLCACGASNCRKPREQTATRKQTSIDTVTTKTPYNYCFPLLVCSGSNAIKSRRSFFRKVDFDHSDYKYDDDGDEFKPNTALDLNSFHKCSLDQSCVEVSRKARDGSLETWNKLLEIDERCQVGFKFLDNKCFLFSEDALTWLDAQSRCQKYGASLVKIDSMTKNTVLGDNIKIKSWIGVYSKNANASYSFDEKFWSFTNYGSPPPNNQTTCATITPSTSTWSSHDCNDTNAYICEQMSMV
eukprot:gene6075-6777_t